MDRQQQREDRQQREQALAVRMCVEIGERLCDLVRRYPHWAEDAWEDLQQGVPVLEVIQAIEREEYLVPHAKEKIA